MKYTQEMINKLIVVEDGKRYIRDINFYNCDLSELDMSNITFQNCIVLKTNLRGTNLRGANLYYSTLKDIKLDWTYLGENNLDSIIINEYSHFTDAILPEKYEYLRKGKK